MKNKNGYKRAFALTELLVVVVVIGVLATLTLPKFSKVLETRKTTEAENILRAVRTEQERRCALDKNYLGDLNKMSDLVPNTTTANYTYAALTGGIRAQSNGSLNYQLQIPSYADGRICCTGADCSQLNKDYPTCDELRVKPDYVASPNECAADVGETPDPAQCGPQPADETHSCPDNWCGQQTRPYICNPNTGTWEPGMGAWDQSACRPPQNPKLEFERENCEGLGYKIRIKRTYYDCDGNVTEVTFGEWQNHCITVHVGGGTGYSWKYVDTSPVFSGHFKSMVPGFLYRGLSWWYDNTIWQLCMNANAHNGQPPTTACDSSNVGRQESVYYVSATPWLQTGPPSPEPCTVLKVVYECVQVQ